MEGDRRPRTVNSNRVYITSMYSIQKHLGLFKTALSLQEKLPHTHNLKETDLSCLPFLFLVGGLEIKVRMQSRFIFFQ